MNDPRDAEASATGGRAARAAYPEHREADVALRDGSTVHVRPVRSGDREPLQTFFEGLSENSRAFRFFSGGADMSSATGIAVDVDYADHYGLVATRDEPTHVVGHGMYTRSGRERAEVAFAIADELQGHGLGTILLAHLAELADEAGITTFEAEVLPENHRMIEVFRESGFPVETSSAPGSIHVLFPTSFSLQAIERFEERERIAAAAAVARFFEPGSIAVIGASRERGTVGGELFHNLLEAGFGGPVYPVNSAAEVVQSVRAYRSVTEVPGPVELAVIAVPGEAAVGAVRECAAKGVRAVVVISAGFGESGAEGIERQRELLAACREAGIRLVGPNCLGVLATRADAPLNATFAPAMPPAGRAAFVSQSGALGLAMIELATDRSLGISSFASIGNRADITANDLLEYWESDPATDLALLYIESFSDPRRFSHVARRVGRSKPIVAVKSGRTPAGARATSSHTGAMLAASDVTVGALFRQAGVIRTNSLAELLDLASLLANQPLPEGGRVGILTNAGGPGIMCADACEAAGLEVPGLGEETRRSLRRLLPPEASVSNPVDMIATATADQYRDTIPVLAASGEVDALIVIFVRPLLTTAEDAAEAVSRAISELPRELPLLAVFMSSRDRAAMTARGGVPTYLYPESAANALARVHHHAQWRRRPIEDPARFADADADAAAAAISEGLGEGGGWLGFERLQRVLRAYGLPLADWRLAGDPDEAGRAAADLRGAVAVKALGPEIVHKTELGALELDLAGARQAAEAAVRIDERLELAGLARERFLVQAMAPAGVEMLLGVVGDPLFGPVVACGAGGVEAELINDVSVRLAPLTTRDAQEMLRGLKTFPLLTGYRGSPVVDVDALQDLLLRTSAMVDAHEEIAELDLNPVIAGADGALVVDARIRVESRPPARPWPTA